MYTETEFTYVYAKLVCICIRELISRTIHPVCDISVNCFTYVRVYKPSSRILLHKKIQMHRNSTTLKNQEVS